MFEESLLESKAESTALLLRRNRWPALLSFSAQAVIAVTMIAVPMLHPELLPLHAPAVVLAAPPVPRPPQPPPPLERVHVLPSASSAPAAPVAAPAAQPILRTLLPATAPSTVDTAISGSVGDMTAGKSPTGLGTIGGFGHSVDVTVVRTTASAAAHAGPVRLSSGVTAGMLLSPIRPDYPAIARAAHQEGAVTIRAVISRTGQIESAEIVSGSPMLATAALAAVQRARYKPYLLNGEPTEVDTTITINFRLGS